MIATSTQSVGLYTCHSYSNLIAYLHLFSLFLCFLGYCYSAYSVDRGIAVSVILVSREMPQSVSNLAVGSHLFSQASQLRFRSQKISTHSNA
uniref:Uncharacterized protein n=1 Tax=Rhipicephalus microplus TaxID=6941 RepID=A0A6M2DDH4_RHIMP